MTEEQMMLYSEDDSVEQLSANEEAWAYGTLRDFADVITSFGPQFVLQSMDQGLLELLFKQYVNRTLDDAGMAQAG